MAKTKKESARKPATRTTARPPAPLVNSLPPQILEEAAQGWLKSSGATPAPSSKSAAQKTDALVDCLDATLKDLRREMAELKERVARLEGRNA
jgi:uncharacterized protein YceH (UPF0502 family)